MRGIYSYTQVIDSFCACVSLDSERSLSSSLASSSSCIDSIISQLFLGYTVPVADSMAIIIQDDRPSAFLQALLDPESHFKGCFVKKNTKAQALLEKSALSLFLFPIFISFCLISFKNLAGHNFDIICV